VVLQECGAGILPIDIDVDGHATLTGGTASAGAPLHPATLLAAVGLTEADLDDADGRATRMAGCGLDFAFVPVLDQAVTRARLIVAPGPVGVVDQFCIVSWDPATASAHARVFAPGSGVPEDPATGSAALGLGVWLVAEGLLPPDAESSYVVKQGAEMLRPSTLECTVSAVDGEVVRATVTGTVVPIAKGEIAVPPFVG
jgi:trans-2,3-dihydro-3-hydroxyanthranilate isomerase